jgi:hypothetical protein
MYRALSTSSRLLEPDEVGGKERLGKDMMQVKQQWKKMLSTLAMRTQRPKRQRRNTGNVTTPQLHNAASAIQESSTLINMASQESSSGIPNSNNGNRNPQNQQARRELVLEDEDDDENVSVAHLQRRISDGKRESALLIGYCQVTHYPCEETFSLTGFEEAPDEQMEEMQLEFTMCCLCQGNVPEDPEEQDALLMVQSRLEDTTDYDTDELHASEEQGFCPHVYHMNCFVRYLQKCYIESTMNSNLPHLLKPAVQCCLCSRIVLWENKKTKEIMPEGYPIYGFHKFKDFWFDGKIICENWITCPYLYMGLQQTLNVNIDKKVVLPHAYKMELTTVNQKIIQNKVENYLNMVMPKEKCSICSKNKSMHLLFGHMPFSNAIPKCKYRLCQDCLLGKLRNDNN